MSANMFPNLLSGRCVTVTSTPRSVTKLELSLTITKGGGGEGGGAVVILRIALSSFNLHATQIKSLYLS